MQDWPRPVSETARRFACGLSIRDGGAAGASVPALSAAKAALNASRAHSPNTNNMVALPWDLSSGERAIFALPTGPMPEAMAMYCLPFTA
jgi:hypothetical protein